MRFALIRGHNFKKFLLTQLQQISSMAKQIEIPVQTQKLLKLTKSTVVPKLTESKHKGEYGRIGVIGGSLEYTGAPYFAAISSLKVGADLVHVFCQQEAAVVIKSYSPELIVHPVLGEENALELIEPWLERLHVLVVGPGLGRDAKIQNTAARVMELCQKISLPTIIDADGLAILNENIVLCEGLRNVILTPNAVEFRRLFGENVEEQRERMFRLGDGVLVLEKGASDKIHIPKTGEKFLMPPGGSGRRCGGQGDLLCGTLATFYNWTLQSNQSNPAFLAAFAASFLVKQCASAAYQKFGRAMLASDMVNEIGPVFRAVFENADD